MSILILAIFTESNSLSSLSCFPLIWLYENILHAEFNQMSCFIIWNFKIAVASHYVITPVIVNFWRYVVNLEYTNSHDIILCTLSFRNIAIMYCFQKKLYILCCYNQLFSLHMMHKQLVRMKDNTSKKNVRRHCNEIICLLQWQNSARGVRTSYVIPISIYA